MFVTDFIVKSMKAGHCLECKIIFFYNFELISVFTFTLYVLLCDCEHPHAFDPIYAFIGSNLLSINTQNRTFFLLMCVHTKWQCV